MRNLVPGMLFAALGFALLSFTRRLFALSFSASSAIKSLAEDNKKFLESQSSFDADFR